MITQEIDVMPKLKKIKNKKAKIKKEKKKKIKKGLEKPESDSESDNLDLSQSLFPLSHYVCDQEDLVSQMFATIRGSKLQAMLPPVLKGIPLKELRRLCLHELQGMSKKRILCTINGQQMEGSSGSEEEEEEDTQPTKTTDVEDTSKREEKKQATSDTVVPNYLLKKIKVEPGLETTKGGGAQEPKSVMELLELQMRARIIKTMLEKDDGKKITEDAIAAVIGNTKLTEELRNVREEKGIKKVVKEVSSRDRKEADVPLDRSSQSSSRKREHRTHPDVGRNRRRTAHEQRKRERSVSSDYEDDKKGSKHAQDLDAQIRKKKKISRKEFEERMKRAKKNRTYRQRKNSEDEEKLKDNVLANSSEETKNEKQDNLTKEQAVVKGEEKSASTKEGTDHKEVTDGKTATEAVAEVSEKEEGEWDSNEEEEGACTPSDASGASDYESSPGNRRRSYSRSWTRSYSRSPSRSRARRRRRRRSYSRSYSRSRSRSYSSRSRSRSRSLGRKKREGTGSKRFHEGRNKEQGKSANSNDPPNNQKSLKDEEENWGQKCDIEFVDSEEDFDDLETTKKGSTSKALSPVSQKYITERASISFSLQKKPGPNINPNVDLDDLPLKANRNNAAIGYNKLSTDTAIEEVKQSEEKRTEEIVISSDSETEEKTKVGKGESSKCNASIDLTQDSKGTIPEENVRIKVAVQESQSTPSEKTNSDKVQVHTVGDPLEKMEKNNQSVNILISETSKDEIDNHESENGTIAETRIFDTDGHQESNKDNSEKVLVRKSGIIANERSDNLKLLEESKMQITSEDDQEDTKYQEDIETKHKKGNVYVQQNDEVVEKISVHFEELKKGNSYAETSDNLEKQDHHNEGVKDGEDSQEQNMEPFTKEEKTNENICTEQEFYQEKTENVSLKSYVHEETQDRTEEEEKANNLGPDDSDNFYKGVENLTFSDDDKEKHHGPEEFTASPTPVQPIRIDTGLIRKPVVRQCKIEMTIPEKSWAKKEKRKKEKSKETLLLEGVGFLKTTLAENSMSPLSPEKSESQSTIQNTSTMRKDQEESITLTSEVTSPGEETAELKTPQDSQETSLSSQDDVISYEDYEQMNDSDNKKKSTNETEIIGVIEASTDPNADQLDLELGGASWSMRWLQSENVQKVVTSSKMFSRVRKKIQKKDKATKAIPAEKTEDTQKKPQEPQVSVIGSIEEYERLFGMKVNKPEEEAQTCPKPEAKEASEKAEIIQEIPETSKKVHSFGSDDEGEDSEEEALWSKIIGK